MMRIVSSSKHVEPDAALMLLQIDGTKSMDEVFSAIDKHLSKLSHSSSHAIAA